MLDYVFEGKLVDTTTPMPRMSDSSANFGRTVALSEDQSTLVVGIPGDDFDENGENIISTDSGAAYVYVKSGGTWVYQQKLSAHGTNARAAGDKFGFAVGISGDTIVVTALFQDYDENGANLVNNVGAAYVFTRTAGVWSQQQKLVPLGTNARTTNSSFGYSVDIDGDTIIVGAGNHPYDENGANSLSSAGAAFIYKRAAGVWSQEQKIVGTGLNGRVSTDNYGYSVGISGDTVVVGAPGQDYDENGSNFVNGAGAAFVYTRSAGVWSLQQKLIGTGVNGRVALDAFGYAVDINGDTVVSGAHLQDTDESGANSVNGAGAAFVYTRTAGVWSQQQKIVPTGTNARISLDSFGKAVSVNGDSLAVGALAHDYDESGANLLTDAGAAFIYTRSGGVWTQQRKFTSINTRTASDSFGVSVSISGDTFVSGAEGHSYDSAGVNFISAAGAAFVYDRIGSTWTLNKKVVATKSTGVRSIANLASMGKAVAVSEDETTVVVGVPNDDLDSLGGSYIANVGAAFVFIKSGGSWVLQQKLVAEGVNSRVASDSFGSAVAISGNTIVVGASGQDYDENGANSISGGGAVFVFIRSGGYWSQQQKIVGTGTNGRVVSDLFGTAVGISGDTLVAGASGQDYDENGANSINGGGAAFVYTRSAGVWNLQQKLVSTGTNARVASDSCGISVAIDSDTVVMGCNGQDYDENGANLISAAGAAYVFKRTAGVWSQEQKIVGLGTNSRVASDLCGGSVAVHGDTLVLGCTGQDTDENGANSVNSGGAAFVYLRTAGVWSLQQKLVGVGTNGRVVSDLFATSVTVHGDLIAVGATGQDYDEIGANLLSGAGAVFIFKRLAGVWNLDKKIVGAGTNGRVGLDAFGGAVGLRGGTVVSGAALHGYDENGANLVTNAGAAFVFKYK